MTYAWADVETTGTRVSAGSEIWEIGVVVRHDEAGPDDPDDEYCWQIRPNLVPADPVSLGIGGYYQRCQIADRPPGSARLTFSSEPGRCMAGLGAGDRVAGADGGKRTSAWDVATVLAPLLAGVTLSGHNIPFDADHLRVFLRENGQCLAADWALLDTGTLVRGWALGRGIKVPPGHLHLRDAIILAGLDPETYDLHQALEDARACRDIYDAVTGREL